MILEQEYNVLVQFLKNKEPQVSLMDPFILQQLEEKGLLQQNELFGPNPEPGKMINGKFLKEIVIGYKQGISTAGRLAILEFDEQKKRVEKEDKNKRTTTIIGIIGLILVVIGIVLPIIFKLI